MNALEADDKCISSNADTTENIILDGTEKENLSIAPEATTLLPELIVYNENMPATAEALRDLFAASQRFFARGTPVRIRNEADSAPSAVPLTADDIIMYAHRLCRPIKLASTGERSPVTLPYRVARMYLAMLGEWNLPPLAGVCTSPLLSADGAVRVAHGYDRATASWCCRVPNLTLPSRPSKVDAEAALARLRYEFRTFPFADAPRRWDPDLRLEVVELKALPGQDESAFLVALQTAVCRASLSLAPGLLMTAPAVSGAGSGKGLLVRAICAIAFGIRPRAFTSGADRHELEKRLAAELIEAGPAVFLDNANGTTLKSDMLASVMTERPAGIRLLGRTQMVDLTSTAFVAITGNGLTPTGDLARRFISCELDAGCEDPELRPFDSGFLEQIEHRRAELLGAALTIWRFGRQNAAEVPAGKPLGSFETWAKWCRDPLLAIGCRDPVERMEALKADDPDRRRIAELFNAWSEHHGSQPVKAIELADAVKAIADPQRRGRQYLATYLSRLAGTRAAGFLLTRQPPVGKWGFSTYSLKGAEGR